MPNDFEKALFAAIKEGKVDDLRAFLVIERSYNPRVVNDEGQTLLQYAIINGQLGCAKIFCEKWFARSGFDVSVYLQRVEPTCGQTLLQSAIISADEHQSPEIFHFMLALVREHLLEEKQETLAPDFIKFINQQDSEGRTALALVVIRNASAFIMPLIQNGGDLFIETRVGSLLAEAIQRGFVETLQCLLAQGMRVDAFDNGGYQPLDRAISCLQVATEPASQAKAKRIIEELLRWGAGLNYSPDKLNALPTDVSERTLEDMLAFIRSMTTKSARISVEAAPELKEEKDEEKEQSERRTLMVVDPGEVYWRRARLCAIRLLVRILKVNPTRPNGKLVRLEVFQQIARVLVSDLQEMGINTIVENLLKTPGAGEAALLELEQERQKEIKEGKRGIGTHPLLSSTPLLNLALPVPSALPELLSESRALREELKRSGGDRVYFRDEYPFLAGLATFIFVFEYIVFLTMCIVMSIVGILTLSGLVGLAALDFVADVVNSWVSLVPVPYSMGILFVSILIFSIVSTYHHDHSYHTYSDSVLNNLKPVHKTALEHVLTWNKKLFSPNPLSAFNKLEQMYNAKTKIHIGDFVGDLDRFIATLELQIASSFGPENKEKNECFRQMFLDALSMSNAPDGHSNQTNHPSVSPSSSSFSSSPSSGHFKPLSQATTTITIGASSSSSSSTSVTPSH